MADKLTPQQAQAVYDRGGRLLVSAAAGSGKTKVLVDRLMTYLTDANAPADLDEFLIITYTKAAASELRGKIAAKLTERIAASPENRHLQKQMQRLFLTKISTVHGFCGDILREYAYKLDIAADFRVADENECAEIRQTVMTDLLDRAYAEAGNDPDFRAFVDTQGLGRDDRLVPEILLKVYDSARCHLDPEGWLESCLRAAEVSQKQDVSETVWGKYLMEELFSYLDSQIGVLDYFARLASEAEGLEKVVINLNDTLFQLRTLRGCDSWDQIVAKKQIDYGRLTFPRKYADPELAERIKAARNACKKGLERQLQSFADPSGQVLSDLTQTAAGTRGIIALVRRFSKEYDQAKRSRRVLDFGDLEHKTLDLLLGKSRSGATAAAGEISQRFREIMVDEYQDSNQVQDAIFTVLTEKRQNCFMVGDVKQSIYQFRLADPGIFLEKYHRYAYAGEAEPGIGRKVLLSHNFRSGPEVIEAVNHVFEACMSPRVGGLVYGEAEALREGVPHDPLPDQGTALYCIPVREDTYAEEAAFVAEKIQKMLREGTCVRKNGQLARVQPEDIVILLRSPGSVGHHFQRALEARGIRCSAGGGQDLMQTEEIATLRSLLQTVCNPRLDIPLISTLASPAFGFTADDLAAIRAKQKKGSFFEALLQDDSVKTKTFLDILQQLRREARMQPLTRLLESCLRLTRLDSIYAAMPGGEARAANLQTFFSLASDFEAGAQQDLSQFLEHLTALEDKGLISAGSSAAGCVSIMSIHKSKGLEFPVVFLCGLSRSFNRESMRAQILCDKELGLGLSVADTGKRLRYPTVAKRAIAVRMTADSLSEELRVLYVAMTRARDRLIMTYASEHLASELEDIALRLSSGNRELLCREVVCPGEWVLLSAMQRTEAGELFALGGKPLETSVTAMPWKISVEEAPGIIQSVSASPEVSRRLPKGAEEQIREGLSFRYPYLPATQAPSKQTATGRKGRVKDAEAAENAGVPKLPRRDWRHPGFAGSTARGKTYGNAVHALMQYIRYEACRTAGDVRAEAERLVKSGHLTREQADMVNCDAVDAFFETPIGRKLSGGTQYLREFKFSILDDGSHYGEGLDGEQVLLQGVVDCALLEEDGITIVDFKTDYVTEDTIAAVADRYRPQLQTYGDALERIYQTKIKAKLLYFFTLDTFVKV